MDTLIEAPKFCKTVRKGMNDLIYYIILYMQITEEQASSWSENPDRFVEDEDDETLSYSVRISAQDVLLVIEQFDAAVYLFELIMLQKYT